MLCVIIDRKEPRFRSLVLPNTENEARFEEIYILNSLILLHLLILFRLPSIVIIHITFSYV